MSNPRASSIPPEGSSGVITASIQPTRGGGSEGGQLGDEEGQAGHKTGSGAAASPTASAGDPVVTAGASTLAGRRAAVGGMTVLAATLVLV